MGRHGFKPHGFVNPIVIARMKQMKQPKYTGPTLKDYLTSSSRPSWDLVKAKMQLKDKTALEINSCEERELMHHRDLLARDRERILGYHTDKKNKHKHTHKHKKSKGEKDTTPKTERCPNFDARANETLPQTATAPPPKRKRIGEGPIKLSEFIRDAKAEIDFSDSDEQGTVPSEEKESRLPGFSHVRDAKQSEQRELPLVSEQSFTTFSNIVTAGNAPDVQDRNLPTMPVGQAAIELKAKAVTMHDTPKLPRKSHNPLAGVAAATAMALHLNVIHNCAEFADSSHLLGDPLVTAAIRAAEIVSKHTTTVVDPLSVAAAHAAEINAKLNSADKASHTVTSTTTPVVIPEVSTSHNSRWDNKLPPPSPHISPKSNQQQQQLSLHLPSPYTVPMPIPLTSPIPITLPFSQQPPRIPVPLTTAQMAQQPPRIPISIMRAQAQAAALAALMRPALQHPP
ncbi:hypothetical protein Pelo_779 [Pelomyxa schiedti]|nr:hypothetical protein Pelo_779 [Pelomyxa schiedti]